MGYIRSMGLIFRVIVWAGTIAMGWVASDVFNEYEDTEQDRASNPTGRVIINAANDRGRFWLVGLGVIVALGLIWALIKKYVLNKDDK